MLIIIPAYNEEKNIGEVVKGALTRGKVLVVDDDSKDRTGRIAEEAGAMVVYHAVNSGYVSALETGYIVAAHDQAIIVQLDADGQHDPLFIPRVSNPVIRGECDICIGSRFSYPYPVEFKKAVGILFFRLMVKSHTGLTITDPTSGFQCLNRKAMLFMLDALKGVKYPDANIIIKAHRAGLRITEVPVVMRPNPQGRSMHRGARKIAGYMLEVLGGIANG